MEFLNLNGFLEDNYPSITTAGVLGSLELMALGCAQMNVAERTMKVKF